MDGFAGHGTSSAEAQSEKACPLVRLIWSGRSLFEMSEIWEYVANDSEAYATQILKRIRIAVEQLPAMLAMGRMGRVAGTRELVVLHMQQTATRPKFFISQNSSTRDLAHLLKKTKAEDILTGCGKLQFC